MFVFGILIPSFLENVYPAIHSVGMSGLCGAKKMCPLWTHFQTTPFEFVIRDYSILHRLLLLR